MAKVLLADSSVTIQKVVELVLSDKGFDVKTVKSGSEALAALSDYRPDIVLADIKLPETNGYDVAAKMRGVATTKDIPVILLTGAFDPIDEGLMNDSGANDSLIKPFEAETLIHKINVLLESGGETPEVADVDSPMEAEIDEPMMDLSEPEGEALEVMDEEVLEVMAEEALEVMDEEPLEVAVEEAIEVMDEEPLEVAVEEALEVMDEGPLEVMDEEPLEVMDEEAIEVAIEEPLEVMDEEPLEVMDEEPLKVMAETSAGIQTPGAQELLKAFRDTVSEKLSEALNDLDRLLIEAAREEIANALNSSGFKDTIMETISPAIQETVEKILWESAPDLTNKLLEKTLQENLGSLKGEIENVIWETVPELAESIIKDEINKIRSET
jgi:DNA-binding response OmpR family regulator